MLLRRLGGSKNVADEPGSPDGLPRGKPGEWTFTNAPPQPVVQLQPVIPPSTKAQVGFWVSILNSVGLMGLGAYCLKNAVDQSTLSIHFGMAASGFLLGVVSLLVPFMVWRRVP